MRPHRIWVKYTPTKAFIQETEKFLTSYYGAKSVGLGYARTYGVKGKFQYFFRVYY